MEGEANKMHGRRPMAHSRDAINRVSTTALRAALQQCSAFKALIYTKEMNHLLPCLF
jgi:hypothetical protein